VSDRLPSENTTRERELVRVEREVQRLTLENGDLLQRLAAASREIERLRTMVSDLKKSRRSPEPQM